MEQFKSKLEQSKLLTQEQIDLLANKVISILIQQPNLIQVQSPQHIIGDIHGQFYDFLKMTKQVIPNNSPCIFLGDYVDRGYHSIQTICYLLVLKCITPHTLILLRGNHQTSSLTRTYGFYDQVLKKYGNHNVWNKIIQVFTYLPLAAVVDNSILCLHGGLSPSLPLLDYFSQIDRVSDIPESGPMCDLVWSDPDLSDKQGWSINSRGAGYVFSKHVVEQFLKLNDLKMVVRAHQLAEDGFCYNFGQKWFVTVWSAPNYCYRCGNEASVMKVDNAQTHDFIKFEAASQTPNNRIHFDNILPYFL